MYSMVPINITESVWDHEETDRKNRCRSYKNILPTKNCESCLRVSQEERMQLTQIIDLIYSSLLHFVQIQLSEF